MSHSEPKSVHTVCSEDQLSPDTLRVLLESSSRPLVVKGQLVSWFNSRCWGAIEICDTLKSNPLTTFKIFPKRGSHLFKDHMSRKKMVAFETDCTYVKAYMSDFKEWLLENYSQMESETPGKKMKLDPTLDSSSGNSDDDTRPCSSRKLNPLLAYPGTQYWVYADYKYMCNLCKDKPDFLQSVDWGIFGFKGRDGKDSTLWIGSEGACTPCHYDTYGYNIVAQLAGEKKWMLFSPDDGGNMYPTRVPFEESSIFSEVDVVDPDFIKHPRHKSATLYQVILKEGDVLVVPKKWWHYVETLGSEPSVSINTWIELPSDSTDRIEEALVRTLMTAFVTDDMMASGTDIINPNEELLSNKGNIQFLFLAIEKYKKSLQSPDNQGTEEYNNLEKSEADEMLKLFLKALTDGAVIKTVAEILIKQTTSL